MKWSWPILCGGEQKLLNVSVGVSLEVKPSSRPLQEGAALTSARRSPSIACFIVPTRTFQRTSVLICLLAAQEGCPPGVIVPLGKIETTKLGH